MSPRLADGALMSNGEPELPEGVTHWPEGMPPEGQVYCAHCGKWKTAEGRGYKPQGMSFHLSRCPRNPVRRQNRPQQTRPPSRGAGRTEQRIELQDMRDMDTEPDDDDIRWAGPEYEEEQRTRRLEKVLTIYQAFITTKEMAVIKEMWATDPEMRNSEYEFFAFLTELAYFKRHYKVARRVVDIVFHDEPMRGPDNDAGYRGRGRSGGQDYTQNPYDRHDRGGPSYDRGYQPRGRGRGGGYQERTYTDRDLQQEIERVRKEEEYKRQLAEREREISEIRIELAKGGRGRDRGTDTEELIEKLAKAGAFGRQDDRNPEVEAMKEPVAALKDALKDKEKVDAVEKAVARVDESARSREERLMSEIQRLQEDKKQKDLKSELADIIDERTKGLQSGDGVSDQARVALKSIESESQQRTTAMNKFADILEKMITMNQPMNTTNLKSQGLTSEEIEQLKKEGVLD